MPINAVMLSEEIVFANTVNVNNCHCGLNGQKCVLYLGTKRGTRRSNSVACGAEATVLSFAGFQSENHR